jgi:hypothetical protein
MGTDEDGFLIPTANQVYPVLQQLDDGVRCLMLDSYMDDGEPMLCHASLPAREGAIRAAARGHRRVAVPTTPTRW